MARRMFAGMILALLGIAIGAICAWGSVKYEGSIPGYFASHDLYTASGTAASAARDDSVATYGSVAVVPDGSVTYGFAVFARATGAVTTVKAAELRISPSGGVASSDWFEIPLNTWFYCDTQVDTVRVKGSVLGSAVSDTVRIRYTVVVPQAP